MPELAEVETLKLYLENKIIGQKITHIIQKRENLRYPLMNNLENRVRNLYIHNVTRRGKYLILHLCNIIVKSVEFSTKLKEQNLDKLGEGASNDAAEFNSGGSTYLVIHLGMSGRFTLQSANHQFLKHDHIGFYLEDKSCLIFNDARRFGMVYFFETSNLFNEKIFSALGPEPLTNDFTAEYLYSKLQKSSRTIKALLMDNNIVVGVGNIYSLESLFFAEILPLRPGNSISFSEAMLLVNSIKTVLNKAIASGGTTLRDFVNGDNTPGYFKQELFVYGRANKKCYKCESFIMQIKMSGRSSYYCQICQK